jgi:hypothetical protein
MTDERDADNQVSAAYRAIANERAPRHLNNRVLSLAARSDGSSSAARSLLASWTKPAAWAAAFCLCVVVALETTQFSGQTTAPVVSVKERFVPQDEQTIREAQERTRNQDGDGQYPLDGAARNPAASERSCEADERESAQAWENCIRRLRNADRGADAEREFASFVLEYPDFPHK